MTLPASGAISFNDVNVELGLSGTAAISLNDAAVRTLFGISSGAISMNSGYGKSNAGVFVAYEGQDQGGSSTMRFFKFSIPPTLANATALGSSLTHTQMPDPTFASNGGNIFIVANSGSVDTTPRFAYSLNAGVSWTTATLPAGEQNYAYDKVAAGYGGFVVAVANAVSPGVRAAYASESNLSSWTVNSTALPANIGFNTCIATSQGYFIIAQNAGGYFYKTTNGSSWTRVTNNLSGLGWNGLSYNPNNGMMMTTGVQSTTSQSAITSDYGATWTVTATAISLSTYGGFYKVTYIKDNTWICTNSPNGSAYFFRTTNNGANWSIISTPDGAFTGGQALTDGAGNVIIPGRYNGLAYYYSTDSGANWTKVTTTGGNAGTSKFPVFTSGRISQMSYHS